MNTLYNLSGDYAALLDLATDPDTDPEAISDTLEGLQLEIADKVDGYAGVYAELEARIKAIDEQLKRFTDMKKACENAKDRMKSYAKAALEKAGAAKFSSDLHEIKVCKNGGALPLQIDETEVPEEYLKTEIVQKPDKDKISKELKLGIELPFARYGERGSYVKIQ